MKKNSGIWIILFALFVVVILSVAGIWTYKVDPFFHFHKPDTDTYYYQLNNERSQNDGITKNFEYDGLITGTSMTQNFKTSEAEMLFGGHFIKVPYSGGTYKELNDNLKTALKKNSNLNIIIRGLDMAKFFDDKDQMREDLGAFPTYLYDDNIFNDVQYIFNRDVIFKRVYPMIKENDEDSFQGGITDFDSYSNWMKSYTFGRQRLFPDGITIGENAAPVHLTQMEKDTVMGNICQNVTALADDYPDVAFYYFFPPYSIAWWKTQLEQGSLDKQIETERIIIEEILKHPNIKLFSFNCLLNITADLNNYKDITHYGEWVNSMMLKYMSEDRCMITPDNYEAYLMQEKSVYSDYNYEQLGSQEDYENDYYAAALLDKEIYNVIPRTIDIIKDSDIELSNAEIVYDQHDGHTGVLCTGRLERSYDSKKTIDKYLIRDDYIGIKYVLNDISEYKYMVYYGKKITDHGQPGVYIYDNNDKAVRKHTVKYKDIDNEWHQYLIDVSDLNGSVTIIFNGGYPDSTGRTDSKYVFSDITLY